MRLDNEQYEEIKQTVIDTYSQYDIKCIPISAFELATKMGIKLVAYSTLDQKRKVAARKFSLDGYSAEMKDGTWIIYYNDEGNNYERINRTIMHEIGHYALGHIEEGEQEEIEANFLPNMLLPHPRWFTACRQLMYLR